MTPGAVTAEDEPARAAAAAAAQLLAVYHQAREELATETAKPAGTTKKSRKVRKGAYISQCLDPAHTHLAFSGASSAPRSSEACKGHNHQRGPSR